MSFLRFLAGFLFFVTILLFTGLVSLDYVKNHRDTLITLAQERLNDRGYEDITIEKSSARGMDLVLTGNVATLETRDAAQAVVDRISGLRATDEANQILAPGVFEAHYDEEKNKITISGSLSDSDLKRRLLVLLNAKNIPIEDRLAVRQSIKNPVYLTHPKFQHLLNQLYHLPQPASIKAGADKIELSGNTTHESLSQWRKTISEIQEDTGANLDIDDRLKRWPSIYHLPGYYKMSTSGLRQRAYEQLQDQLFQHQVYFEVGISTIDEFNTPMMDNLKKLSEVIKTHPRSVRYVLGGHADATGNAETNQILSEKRAKSVKDWLMFDGVDPEQLRVVSFGSVTPVGNPQTAEDRAKSRRVEAVIE